MSKTDPSVEQAAVPSKPRTALGLFSRHRLAGTLLALLILTGIVVGLMFVVRRSSRNPRSQVALPMVTSEVDDGELPGRTTTLDRPARGEVVQETSLQQPELRETLSLVASAVEDRADLLDDPATIDRLTSGRDAGTGRSTRAGPGIGGGDRPRRWELRFPRDNTLEAYAKQLDFFGIELGVLLPGDRVQYVYNLSKAQPDQHSGAADEENRCYLTWRRGELEQADRDLLARAKVDCQDRLILKFLPEAIEKQLLALEQAGASHSSAGAPTTVFGIKAEGNGYAFYVIEQTSH